jgi:glycerate 2-kinase
MRILLAPDKFKGSLSAKQVAEAMALGVRRANPDAMIDFCPMADGGEGTVDAFLSSMPGRYEARRVTGPLPEMKVDARFAILKDEKTAVIEMAAASGLALLKPEDRSPMRTTSFGAGELLMAAADLGVEKIILGIGGSATIDAGIGAAQACGLPVILEDGEPLSPTEPLTGADLEKVVLIKHGRGSRIEKIKIIVAADVTNPLYGETGAARIFGAQKGATPEEIEKLDADLRELARRTGKQSIAQTPGAGAAGGLGFAMMAFFGAELCSGVDLIIDAVRLRERLLDADLCFTGEGRLDSQSLAGKTVAGVAKTCRRQNVPCVAIAGTVENDIDFASLGIEAIPIRRDGLTLEESMQNAADLIALEAQAVCSARFPR